MYWKTRAAFVWFLGAALVSALHAQEKEEKPEPAKLTLAEQRLVAQLEKLLITQLAGRSNPNDQYTYYVLMFVDQAEATTVTSGTTTRGVGTKRTTVPRTTTKVDLATARAAMLVQGRRNAALKVGQYLVSQNAAAGALAEAKGKRATDGAREWDYRAFFVEEEAKAFYESIKPKDAAPAK